MSSGIEPVERVGVDMRRDHGANRLRRGLMSQQTERFGSAPLNQRVGIGNAVISAGAAAASPIRPIANAAICLTSGSASVCSVVVNAGIASGSRTRPRAQSRSTPDARFRIGQQRQQVAAAATQLTLVFELQDPSHLLLEHRRRWRRGDDRRGRRAATVHRPQKAQDQPGPQKAQRTLLHRLKCRNVALSIRSLTILTPIPGPWALQSCHRGQYQSPAR